MPTSKRAKAPQIPYPELPSSTKAPRVLFWRAAWLRAEAERAALKALWDELRRRRKSIAPPAEMGLIGAIHALESDARECLGRVVEYGGILYAWLPEGGQA